MEGSGLTWQIVAQGVAIVATANLLVLLVYKWVFKRVFSGANPPSALREGPMVGVLAQEVDDLRERLAAVNNEVERLKAAKPGVSPYNQALHMARNGFPAAEVAAHCGISRGEAELIIALCKKTSISDFE